MTTINWREFISDRGAILKVRGGGGGWRAHYWLKVGAWKHLFLSNFYNFQKSGGGGDFAAHAQWLKNICQYLM